MKNQVILVGVVESIQGVKTFAAGTSSFFTLRVNNQIIGVNAWDNAARYVGENLHVGDTVYVNGYLHAYKKEFGNGASGTRWTVKTQNIYKETAYVTLQGIVSEVSKSMITMKPFIDDANYVIVAMQDVNLGDRIINIGDSVTVTGILSFAGYSAVTIRATSVY